ncbi:MAG: hypothetical protein FE041_00800, partial [Thermoplasmata archaeon]
MRKKLTILYVFLLISSLVISPLVIADSKKVTISCFNENNEIKKQISLSNARYIYHKICEIQQGKATVDEIIHFLSKKNIISIPLINMPTLGYSKQYNIFCYVYGTAEGIGTLTIRNAPLAVLSSIFPPFVPIFIFALAFPRLLMILSEFICFNGKITTTGLLGEWEMEGFMFGGIILGFIGIKAWIPPNNGFIFG